MTDLHGQEREALEFYADPAQWDGAAEAIWHDSGTRARAALAAREEPGHVPPEPMRLHGWWLASQRHARDVEKAMHARTNPDNKYDVKIIEETVPGATYRIDWPAGTSETVPWAREDTERPDGGDPVLPDGAEGPIASLHDALAILSLILLRAKTEPHRADRDRVRLLRFFSGEDTERPDGVALIAAERDRQVREEGWTAEHDDTHTNGELAVAAACYLLDHKIAHPPGNWPFEVEAWKPARRTGETRIDELVKAGAMVAAQIDIHLRDPERHTGKPDCKCKDCLAYDASSPR